MSTETKKLTLAEIDSMEMYHGAARENLEGWVPDLASDEALRDALDKAFDYRGDVTLTLKSGDRFEAFIFDRHPGATLEQSSVRYFTAASEQKQSLSYAQIARIEFTGKDRAAGKQWEDWVRKYNERKAAGEKNIALAPEALD